MRKTSNLGLTQFDGSDVPNWLDQYNTDMKKIDDNAGSQNTANTAYENRFEADELKISDNRNQIDENTQDIANIKSNIRDITGGSTTSIDDLSKKVKTLETESESIDGRVETLEDTCTNLETSVGNKPIGNVGASITEAIGNTAINFRGITTGGMSNIMESIATFIGNEIFTNIGGSKPTNIVNAINMLSSLTGITVEELGKNDLTVEIGNGLINPLGNVEISVPFIRGLKISFGDNSLSLISGEFVLIFNNNKTTTSNSMIAKITKPNSIGAIDFVGVCSLINEANTKSLRAYSDKTINNGLYTMSGIEFLSKTDKPTGYVFNFCGIAK